jgi:hypothetical protein
VRLWAQGGTRLAEGGKFGRQYIDKS